MYIFVDDRRLRTPNFWAVGGAVSAFRPLFFLYFHGEVHDNTVWHALKLSLRVEDTVMIDRWDQLFDLACSEKNLALSLEWGILRQRCLDVNGMTYAETPTMVAHIAG